MSRSTGDLGPGALVAWVAVAVAAAACSEPAATIDLCGRGDWVEFPGGVRVSFLDGEGGVIDFGEVSPDPDDHLDVSPPSGAVEILVEGKDVGGTTIAHGRARLGDADTCVCVAQEAQYLAACERVVCRAEAGSCLFVNQGTGDPIGARTIVIGENADDTAGGVSDTFLRSSNDKGNFGLDVDMNLSGTEIALLRFDLTVFPAASVIEGAALRLFATDNGTGEDVPLSRVLEVWDEGVQSGGDQGDASWCCRQFGTFWTDPGCGAPRSRAPTALATITLTPLDEATAESAELTQAVQDWVEAPETNFGVAASCGCDATLVSSQGTDGQRPRLAVTYTLP